MRRYFACLAILSVLTACSPEISEGEPAAASATVSGEPDVTILAGVDLSEQIRLLGTEPFWAITVDDTDVLLERPDAAPRHFTPSGFHVIGNRAELRSTTLSIVLTPGPCSDGMSDRQYPLTAEVRLDTDVLKGCAITKTDLDTTRP